MTDDLAIIARNHHLPLEQVARAVQLLDEGNTIPFITRFRKDQTGGLDADQLRAIKQRVGELRALNERKSFILKSIESQGALTEELTQEIKQATNSRRLEDLYLPYKAKKQSLALTAKQQGLEPLANDIYSGEFTEEQIATRTIDFVRVDRGLNSVQDVMQGVCHLIAERFAERSDLRRELRAIIWQTGQLTSKLVQPIEKPDTPPKAVAAAVHALPPDPQSATCGKEMDVPIAPTQTTTDLVDTDSPSSAFESQLDTAVPSVTADSLTNPLDNCLRALEAPPASDDAALSSEVTASVPPPPTMHVETDVKDLKKDKLSRSQPRKKAKHPENPFRDYHDFAESLKRIPHHRVLAINRGERAGQLKAKVKVEYDKLAERAVELLVPGDHPFSELMTRCAHDALARLILPSLEREVRRELTETAEQHAVTVFARNLRSLLLKPPVRGKRILSIDPGYKSGCATAILDCRGNVLHTDRLFVVGNAKRRSEHQLRLADWVRQYEIDVIAIGNGAACRETEQMVSDTIREHLADRPVKYVIVNEAGASVYSTSEIGCEELPGLPPHARSAVSIGRRLLDPLSELVKISPGHLGVGLYQHDIKAKHLSESLDEVVELCVNHVGVDANTSSPALLRYVAGLNQATAKRLIEFRQQTPISHRQVLREVPGIGETTFVQSAGFLRVYGGTEPYDETAIHPESYSLCDRILARIGWTKQQWIENRRAIWELESSRQATDGTAPGKPMEGSDDLLAKIDAAQLAHEFQVGEMLMRDLIDSLRRPLHDPRQEYDGPVFRSGIIKLEDLQPGMKLESQIVNVVDFGVFVDIGLGYSCLVHISQLSRRFVRNLYEAYSVGDHLTTWVKEIDSQRRRVKLSAIEPGVRRGHGQRRADNRVRHSRQSQSAASTNGENQTAMADRKRAGQPRPQTSRFDATQSGTKHAKKPSAIRRQAYARPHTRPSKPKPVVPITNEMIDGKKPMRSFSDLAQFFQIKKEPPGDNHPPEEANS